ncbi:hypothetical protein Lalb_Chr01g0017501 [Lupinus albus]|uniref:Uncharacterized protein n=1 Tax=Lupinus albus TaxID=3870 RepID=A0A6A4R6L4_LUPAL|nr:hypothetical protein Lalb_Chr01g0017501 [Lupinus albus]
MLQLVFVIAFSTVPLTLYIPPIRSFNLFVHTIQHFLRDSNLFSLHSYFRITLPLFRFFNSMVHVTW